MPNHHTSCEPISHELAYIATERLRDLRRAISNSAPFDETVECARRLVAAADKLEPHKYRRET